MLSHSRLHTLFLFSGLVATMTFGQQLPLVSFNPNTLAVDTIPVAAVADTVFAAMPHSYGVLPGWVALQQDEPPAPFVGAQNVRPERAGTVFDLSSYPVRTAGSIRRMTNNVERNLCSASLVGPQHIVTARHCVRGTTGVWRMDTLYFAPVFDDGSPGPFGRSRVIRYIVPVAQNSDTDFAILELEEPIGLELGWFGLAFNEEPNYYSDKIIHKLSYPGDTSLLDPSLIYNGDTLYHQYTPMERMEFGYLGVPGSGLAGIPGESGSAAMVSDNVDYLITGVTVSATNYRHAVLDAWYYHQFASVLAGFNVGVEDRPGRNLGASFYPNPVTTHANVVVAGSGEGPFLLTLFDQVGRVVQNHQLIGSAYQWRRNDLVAGVYVYRIVARGSMVAHGRLVVE